MHGNRGSVHAFGSVSVKLTEYLPVNTITIPVEMFRTKARRIADKFKKVDDSKTYCGNDGFIWRQPTAQQYHEVCLELAKLQTKVRRTETVVELAKSLIWRRVPYVIGDVHKIVDYDEAGLHNECTLNRLHNVLKALLDD